ncbi:MAG: ThuA domain-containing protein [Sedimentisphaerales bacterium]|nr:ThuA domain-containing protein [Sedimentisphaerales bacterium]
MKHFIALTVFVLVIAVLITGVIWAQDRKPSEQEIAKMKEAMPAKPTVKPAQPRKMLVFSLCQGFKHGSITYWDEVLKIMGEKSGAFSVEISRDLSVFNDESLKQFDVICFNNTTQLKTSPEQRKAILNFLQSGKGIVGIHAATDNFYDWPQMQEIMGGKFTGHPWGAGGTWAVKIDEPNHPLTKAFEGKGFKVKDEIYRTDPPMYDRSKQRVLMSLDMSDPTTAAKKEKPEDDDVGITWIKEVGKGRVFYGSLGHNNHLTWWTPLLQHYLDGIQFAIGDLKVPVQPQGK